MERRTGIETVQAAVRVGASFIDTADCASVHNSYTTPQLALSLSLAVVLAPCTRLLRLLSSLSRLAQRTESIYVGRQITRTPQHTATLLTLKVAARL